MRFFFKILSVFSWGFAQAEVPAGFIFYCPSPCAILSELSPSLRLGPADSPFFLFSELNRASRARLGPFGLVFPNRRIQAFQATADPDFNLSWGLQNQGQTLPSGLQGHSGKDVDAVGAWSVSGDESAAIVAVIDTGIDLHHEDLKTRLWVNPKEVKNGKDDDGNGYVDDINGWNFVSHRADPQDDNDHGTSVAGIIVAEPNNGKGSRGVVKARVMALKALDESGNGTTAQAIAAIEYARAAGAHVINASWGAYAFDGALYEAVRRAIASGLLVVAAAGNDGKNNDTDPAPAYPASFDLPGLVSVAAYDAKDRLAIFSSYGKHSVDIGAPGLEIYAPARNDRYRYVDGTSFATPFVTGVAALVLGRENLTPTKLEERLLSTSEVIHYYEQEKLRSAGRVHAGNALRNIQPPRPSPPSFWHSKTVLVSPPTPYANKETYRFEFSEPGAERMRVHFRDFETEEDFDFAVVQDGGGRVVTRYSGALGDFESADVLGDRIIIELKTDFVTAAKGFEIDRVEWSKEKWPALRSQKSRPKKQFRD